MATPEDATFNTGNTPQGEVKPHPLTHTREFGKGVLSKYDVPPTAIDFGGEKVPEEKTAAGYSEDELKKFREKAGEHTSWS